MPPACPYGVTEIPKIPIILKIMVQTLVYPENPDSDGKEKITL
jgi:hypothetical protein